MVYYRTCPRCGAHLDPGESCDCLEVERAFLLKCQKLVPQFSELSAEEIIERLNRMLEEQNRNAVEQNRDLCPRPQHEEAPR